MNCVLGINTLANPFDAQSRQYAPTLWSGIALSTTWKALQGRLRTSTTYAYVLLQTLLQPLPFPPSYPPVNPSLITSPYTFSLLPHMEYPHEINSRRLTPRGMTEATLNYDPSTFMYLPSSPPPQQLYSNTLQPVGTEMELTMLPSVNYSGHSAWGGVDPALQGMFSCAESYMPFRHSPFSPASYEGHTSSPTRMYSQEELLTTPFPSSSRDVLHASTCLQELSVDGVVPSSTPAHVASFAGYPEHLFSPVGQYPATSPMENRSPTPTDAKKLVAPICNICGFGTSSSLIYVTYAPY